MGDLEQPPRQELDIENTRSRLLLVPGEQIHEQGGQPGAAEHIGYESVARTVPAAAAAVREDDQPERVFRHCQVSGQLTAPDLHDNLLVALGPVGSLARPGPVLECHPADRKHFVHSDW